MAVYEGESFHESGYRVRTGTKRRAEVDVETIATGSKGPKLEVGQARPAVVNSVDSDHLGFMTELDDKPPSTFMIDVSLKKFNSLEKKHDKQFRYMRYKPSTKEVELVDDGDKRHEAAERNTVVQIAIALHLRNLPPQEQISSQGGQALIPNPANHIKKVPDGSWAARGAVGPPSLSGGFWPTVLMEVGFSQSLPSLYNDVREWLVPDNPVQLVMVVKVGYNPRRNGTRTMLFEAYRRDAGPTGQALPPFPAIARIDFGTNVPIAQPPQAQFQVSIPWKYFYANDPTVLRALGLTAVADSFAIAAALQAIPNVNLPQHAQGNFVLDLLQMQPDLL